MEKTAKIYTKTGDQGTSSTFTGERRCKDDPLFEALGTNDELSSSIGLAREFINPEKCPDMPDKLELIQSTLEEIGSCISTPYSTARVKHLEITAFNSKLIQELEEWIDQYSDELPPLKNFILPSGGLASAHLHIARSICRRAERLIVPLVRNGEMSDEPAKYMNRLSDFLFVAARYAAFKDGKKEFIYRNCIKANNSSFPRKVSKDQGTNTSQINIIPSADYHTASNTQHFWSKSNKEKSPKLSDYKFGDKKESSFDNSINTNSCEKKVCIQ